MFYFARMPAIMSLCPTATKFDLSCVRSCPKRAELSVHKTDLQHTGLIEFAVWLDAMAT